MNRTIPTFQVPKPTHQNIIVDGVQRYPPIGLNVLVVGAGPGGYLTALECWRKGIDVKILEKESGNSSIGDGAILGPTGLATLHNYPTMLKSYDSVSDDIVASFRRFEDGKLVAPPEEFEWNNPEHPEHAAWPLRIRSMVDRAALNLMFYDQVKRLGIPITFGVKIVDFEDGGMTSTAVAADGTRYTADIVVAADGLGSRSFAAVLGHPMRATSTGYAICRVRYQLGDLSMAPHLRKVVEENERPDLRMYSGKDFHALAQITKTHVLFALTSPDDGTAKESWSTGLTSDEVLALIGDQNNWDPVIIDVIRCIPSDKIVRWQICWRDPQPKWTSTNGRVVQVGDSAHAFIPSSFSGATCALEDAQSLAECLRLAGKENANLGTKIHELLRYQRVDILQRMGFSNRREAHNEEGMMGTIKGDKGPLWLGKWVWTHKPEQYVKEKFVQARAHIETGESFAHSNIPPGFKWEPWSMEEETKKEKMGIVSQDLKTNGDWSIV